MAMMAALPLAEMAGSAVAPALENMVGKEMYGKLAPLAKKGLSKVVNSKAIHKIGGKIGNKLFGKSKTARKMMKGASKVAGIATGKGAQKLVKSGLGIGKDLGLVSSKTADNIMSGYGKALSLHDKLSKFNQPKDAANVQELEVEPLDITPQEMAKASEVELANAPPHTSSVVEVAHELEKEGIGAEKARKLGDILELMGVNL